MLARKSRRLLMTLDYNISSTHRQSGRAPHSFSACWRATRGMPCLIPVSRGFFAVAIGDRSGEADGHYRLGQTAARVEAQQEALRQLRTALSLTHEIGETLLLPGRPSATFSSRNDVRHSIMSSVCGVWPGRHRQRTEDQTQPGALSVSWFSKISGGSREPLAGGRVIAFDLPPGLRRPVLLTLANPAHAAALTEIAARIAAARQTAVVLLHIVRPRAADQPQPTGDPTAWPALAAGLAVMRQAGGTVGWIVRTGDDVGRAIRETAADLRASLIILGWRGTDPQRSASLAEVLEDPLCDVAVVSTGTHRTSRRILASIGPGPHAALAARLAGEIAYGAGQASITALHVVQPGHPAPQVFTAAARQFRRALGRDLPAADIVRKTIVSDDVAQAILEELTTGYDIVLLGTSREALIDRLAFGDVPQRIAQESPATVVVARRHMPMATRMLRETWQALTDALPTLSADERAEVQTAIRQGARGRADFFVMIGLAAVLATLGLLLNSPAVIIGAMLVAPLMSAMVGLGLGLVEGDTDLLRVASWASFRGMVLAIAVGALLGLVIPDASATAEVMSRARPSLLDLGVALASGAAGAYALCRKEVSASLAGVAIAAALVPPLATVGIGLALGRGDIAGGALLLFLTNLIAIAAAGSLVFLMLGFAPAASQKAQRNVLRRGLAGAVALLAVVTIILGILTAQAVRSARLDRTVQAAVRDEIAALLPGSEFVELKQAAREDGTLQLAVTVRSSEQYPYATVLAFQRGVAARIQRPVALLLNVIPATRLDSLAPPTFTPMPTPTGTATQGPNATTTASPTATPPPTATATATATPTPTPTPTATATATATPSPTATATATPRPTPGVAVIASPNGQGVYLRSTPGGAVIGAVGEGTPVILLGERAEAGGRMWARVLVPGKPGGWIALDYLALIPMSPPYTPTPGG